MTTKVIVKNSIIVLFMFLASACSSSNSILNSDKDEVLDLKLDLQTADINSNLNQDKINTFRIVIADKHSNRIVKNEIFQRSNDIEEPRIILKDVPTGTYNIYALANEKAILSITTNNIDLNDLVDLSDLINVTTKSTDLHEMSSVPYKGILEDVLIDKEHVNISIPLKRLVSKFIIKITNEDNEMLELKDLSIGNVMDAYHTVFYESFIQVSTNSVPVSLSQDINIQVPAMDEKTIVIFMHEARAFFQTNKADLGLTLSFKTVKDQLFEPIALVEKDGGKLYRIVPNHIYNLSVKILQNKNIVVDLNKYPWEKCICRVPDFY